MTFLPTLKEGLRLAAGYEEPRGLFVVARLSIIAAVTRKPYPRSGRSRWAVPDSRSLRAGQPNLLQ